MTQENAVVQISHEGADDSALADLVGEAKTEDEMDDFGAQERRIKAVELAIAGYERMPETDLISAASSIERYILKGHKPKQPDADAEQAPVGARAFVENEDGTVKAV